MRLAGYVEQLIFPPSTCSLNSSALLDRIRGLGADAGGYVHEAGGRRVVAYRPLYNDVLAIHDGLVYVVEVGDAFLNSSTHGFIGAYTL
ncbi:MAG: hypothetical protein QI199_02330 [Candidatus Korarchaeota archaeon]|nr:hypothetical protein [Candidatus Korarchaeota archaeon]